MSEPIEKEPIPAVIVQLFDGKTVSQFKVVSEWAQAEFCRFLDSLMEEAEARMALAA